MSVPREVPDAARIVVIGGGVGGVSVAYHLSELGERDIVVLDRDELTSGSTFHSAGLVGQLRADPTLTRMNMYSVELYRRLQHSDQPVGWIESGGIKLASTPERLEEIRRQISWARTYDLPLHEISVAEAAERFPLLNTEGVVGASYLESDGYLDPAQLTYSMAAAARANGVRILTRTRVLGLDVQPDRYGGRITGVSTDRGHIDCEIVVNCGGMFAAELGRLAGVRIPLVPMSHQYLITDAFLRADAPGAPAKPLPTLRDPDLLVYFRQEVAGLLMGGYERNPAAFTATDRTVDAIAPDFNGRLLPEDWTRFEEITINAQHRVPALADIGIKQMINGPEAFTPDNEFCLGETAVAGFFVAAGFCAHGIAGAGGIGKLMAEWITAGEPTFDVWHMDINRFGAQWRSPGFTLARTIESYQRYYDIPYPGLQREVGRPLRTAPAYPWHREHGAQFEEKAGWERVGYYAPNGEQESADHESPDAAKPAGWAGLNWSPATGVEHAATRQAAGLFDETSFSKLEVSGPDAASFLEWACDNRVARGSGAVTYTQALNSRGGIEADFTVTRTGEDDFLIITGTAYGTHDAAWLRKQARRAAADVRITDVTGLYCCYALWGPRAREILGALTSADLNDDAFGFMTSQEITVADIPVRALRVTFVGEHGWELYASSEYGARLWTEIWHAGAGHGLVACGYRAIESLRLEKGYRVWGSDLSAETNPFEAGLGFCVKLDKRGGFEGREALLAARDTGLARKLCAIVIDDPKRVVVGSEPVTVNGRVSGRVTSGGYGHTTRQSIAYAYLAIDDAAPGTSVEIDLFADLVPGTVVAEPVLAAKAI